ADCGGEAVQERLAADRTELSCAEEARERVAAERLAHGAGVVVRLGEHVRAAPVAGEEEGAGRPLAVQGVSEALAEIIVGRAGVADVEAERLADAYRLADRERARLLVGADQPAYQVVAAPVLR